LMQPTEKATCEGEAQFVARSELSCDGVPCCARITRAARQAFPERSQHPAAAFQRGKNRLESRVVDGNVARDRRHRGRSARGRSFEILIVEVLRFVEVEMAAAGTDHEPPDLTDKVLGPE